MALKFIFSYSMADLTESWLSKDKDIIPSGVWKGGDILPGTGLSVDVEPFVVATKEGATVREDTETHTVAVLADNLQYYVGVLHKYVARGAAVVEVTTHLVSDYPTWVDKDYFTILGIVQVPIGVTQVLNSHIDSCTKDLPSGAFLSKIEIVATTGDLPTLTCADRGQVRFVLATRQYYIWDGANWLVGQRDTVSGSSSWAAIAGGAYKEILHPGSPIGNTNYRVNVTPTQITNDDVGEIWVDKQNDRFRVYRGGGYVGNFDWTLILS